jgi:hypothetical protein
VVTLRKELMRLSRACGMHHPSMVTLQQFDILDAGMQAIPARKVFEPWGDWGLPSAEDQEMIIKMMTSSPEMREAMLNGEKPTAKVSESQSAMSVG